MEMKLKINLFFNLKIFKTLSKNIYNFPYL